MEIMNLRPEAPQIVAETKVRDVPIAGPASSHEEPTFHSLRAELTQVRQALERHDKMLRYIMDRYVEKAPATKATPTAQGAKVFEEHHAVEVNFSKPEFAHAGEIEAAVSSSLGDRSETKRRGSRGGDMSVGLAIPEASSAGDGSSAAQPSSGAVSPALAGVGGGARVLPEVAGTAAPAPPSDGGLQLRGGGPGPEGTGDLIRA